MTFKYNEKSGEFERDSDWFANDVYVLCEEVISDCFDVVAVFSSQDLAVAEMKKRNNTTNKKHIIKVKTLDKVHQNFDWTLI